MKKSGKYFIVAFLLIAILFNCKKKGKNNIEACNGDTRRDVKVCIDALTSQLDTHAVFTTITSLGELSVPDVNSETGRLDLEKKIYTVKCKIDKASKERDGDIHIRLVEGDNYLIAESANPECDYATGSIYVAAYKKVRDFLTIKDLDVLEGKEIYITGVAFVDIDHGYKRKQAKNNIELHPILDIHF
ncbi:MAG: hypothetical protein IAF38_16140 [Bacteroidia bacterium]|nr:hypothetical protein [Bacteroidia bacterium]